MDCEQQITDFIETLLGDHTGIAMMLAVNKAQSGGRNVEPRPFEYPAERAEMATFASRMDAAGMDTYLNVSLYERRDLDKTGKYEVRATKDFHKASPCIWLDADACNPDYLDVPPTVVLETSPSRYQAFWKLDTPLTASEAEVVSRAIAYKHQPQGSDIGGWAATKYMRLPGLHNFKPERKLPDDGKPVVSMLRNTHQTVPVSAFDTVIAVEQAAAVIQPFTGDDKDWMGTGSKFVLTDEYPAPPDLGDGKKYPADILAIWNAHQLDDRSKWAFAVVMGLYQCGLKDDDIKDALVEHPIYVQKAEEKWGGREYRIREDVDYILRKLRERGISQRMILSPLAEEIKGVLTGGQAISGDEPEAPRMLTALDVVRLPRVPWLIEGYLPQRAHINVFGPSGIGKSFQVLDWAFHIALGRDWNNSKIATGPVVYIVAEGLDIMGVRIESWCKHYGVEIPDQNNLLFYGDAVQIKNESSLYRLVYDIDKACADKPALIIFDTLSQCLIGANENSPEDMSTVNGVMAYLRSRYACSTLVVHHTGHDSDHERGHSSFPASADTRVKIDVAMGQLTVDCAKQRSAEEFRTVYCDLVKVGESLVLVPAVEPAKTLTIDSLMAIHEKILNELVGTVQRPNNQTFGQPQGYAAGDLASKMGLTDRRFARYRLELEQSGMIQTVERSRLVLTNAGEDIHNKLKTRRTLGGAASLSSAADRAVQTAILTQTRIF